MITRNNIAQWTGRAGSPEEALRLNVELLPIRERVLGPTHPDTLITRRNIAYWTGETGDPDEALDWAERAVTGRPTDPNMFYRYAMCLAALDRVDEAREALSTCP